MWTTGYIEQMRRLGKGGLGQSEPPVPPSASGAAEFIRSRLGLEPDAKQLAVLESGAKRILLNCTRQWGKSTITAARAVYEAATFPKSLTLVVSPSERQSAEFVRKAAVFCGRLGIRPRGDGDNEISLLFPNESRIVGLPGREATARGYSAVTLLIVDEASRVDDDLYRALRPTMAVSDGRLWMMSTPFGKRGFFWEAWEKGGPAWTRIAVPATECPRIGKAFLDEERRSQGERWFRQEYLCEFVDGTGTVFGRGLVEAALTRNVRPLIPGYRQL